MPKLRDLPTTPPKAAPGRRTLQPCALCACVVVTHLAQTRTIRWDNPEEMTRGEVKTLRWKRLMPPQSPVLGADHTCAVHWTLWVILARMRPWQLTETEEGEFVWVDPATGEVYELEEVGV